MAAAVADTGRYLYAVTGSLDPGRVRDAAGLRDQPLELVTLRDLVAVVSDVPLAEFDEQALKRNLENMEWLEEVARRHDEVVRDVARHGPTAPLRLATICRDDEGVRRLLEEWYADIEQVLARIEGRGEWSVKVIVPPEDEPAAGGTPAAGQTGGGAAYLRAKKAQGEARRERQERVARLGDDVHARLVEATVASRLLRPQDPGLSGHVGAMVLNGAYLVEQREAEAFATLVGQVADAHPGVTVECGGPWPPYSFAVLERA